MSMQDKLAVLSEKSKQKISDAAQQRKRDWARVRHDAPELAAFMVELAAKTGPFAKAEVVIGSEVIRFR